MQARSSGYEGVHTSARVSRQRPPLPRPRPPAGSTGAPAPARPRDRTQCETRKARKPAARAADGRASARPCVGVRRAAGGGRRAAGGCWAWWERAGGMGGTGPGCRCAVGTGAATGKWKDWNKEGRGGRWH